MVLSVVIVLRKFDLKWLWSFTKIHDTVSNFILFIRWQLSCKSTFYDILWHVSWNKCNLSSYSVTHLVFSVWFEHSSSIRYNTFSSIRLQWFQCILIAILLDFKFTITREWKEIFRFLFSIINVLHIYFASLKF